MSFISEEEVERLLQWDELVSVIKSSMVEVTNGTANMPERLFMDIPEKPAQFLLMPCFSSLQNLVTCKLVTIFPKNSSRNGKPTISAVICVFDGDNGSHLYTMGGTIITEWRTAAASIVATEHLYCRVKDKYKKKTLAVLGIGKQGVIHVKGFQNYFKFGNIRIWNRTNSKAIDVANKLKTKDNIDVVVSASVKECVLDADVVVVAFSETREVLLRYEDLKPATFICLAGTATVYPSGIDTKIYQTSRLFTGSVSSTNLELKDFIERENLNFEEIGSVIDKDINLFEKDKFVLFQSLGMSIMDNAAAKYVLDKYQRSEPKD